MLPSSGKICEFVIAENLKIWKCARKNKRVCARPSHAKEKSWLRPPGARVSSKSLYLRFFLPSSASDDNINKKSLLHSLCWQFENCRNDLTSVCDARSYSRLTYLIRRLNRRLYDQISAIKEEKFSRLATTQPARYTRNTQTMNTVLQDNS